MTGLQTKKQIRVKILYDMILGGATRDQLVAKSKSFGVIGITANRYVKDAIRLVSEHGANWQPVVNSG